MTWKDTAELLASRMVHYNFCEEHVGEKPEVNMEECPFCKDRYAFQFFLRMRALDRHPSRMLGPT